ncbi:MAG: molybdenum cofactor guanylyltransferase [Oscillospiraceae bacterium]|nr:molybdenum cofactor guanylyltransferase [Oscillospiraceae bacterium]
METIVILAGGRSRRMGRDKLALPLDGKTLLESVISRFEERFDSVYLSVADAVKYPEIKTPRLVDIASGAGPLSGLHAALTLLPAEGVFLVAADLPFADPSAAQRIIELCNGHEACVLRLPGGFLEPLFGFYRRPVLKLCEDALSSGDYRMSEILHKAHTRFVEPSELGQFWDEKIIMNVNSPEDYQSLTATNSCSYT